MAAVSQARWAVQLAEDEMVRAVRSLYDDQVKPYGRILIRRLGEHAIERSPERRSGPPPFINAKSLRVLCESSRGVHVHCEEAKEYSVTLVGLDSHVFVDPADKRDPYPQELWDELAAHFADGGPGCNEALPASRYSCAQALGSLGLPCLRGLSLGALNHVVALAMTSNRSILGYKDGRVIPYKDSDASVREQCAAHALPVPSLPNAPQGVATWETARFFLWELLSRAGGEIKLPNVKRLFRSEFGVQLSETALGHQRVQDLLQDPRLCDVCVLQRRESVHMVLKVEPPACPVILSTTPPAAEASTPLAPQLDEAELIVPPPALQPCFPALPASPCQASWAPASLPVQDPRDIEVQAQEWQRWANGDEEEKKRDSPWDYGDHAGIGDSSSCSTVDRAILPIPDPRDIEAQAQEWQRWAEGDEEEKKRDSPWDYGDCAGTGGSSSSSTVDRSRATSDGDATCPICLVPMSAAEERFLESPWILPSSSPPASLRASGSGSTPGAAAGAAAGPSGALGGRSGRFAALLEADGTTEASNASVHVPDMESATRSAARRPCRSLPPSIRLASGGAERAPEPR